MLAYGSHRTDRLYSPIDCMMNQREANNRRVMTLGGRDPALDGGGLGGAAAQVALHRRPAIAADDFGITREEALLGLGRVARRSRRLVGGRGGEIALIGRLIILLIGMRRGSIRACCWLLAWPAGGLIARAALGFRLAVGHLVGVERA